MYLAEILKGLETGVYRLDGSGASTADFAGMMSLRLQYAAPEEK